MMRSLEHKKYKFDITKNTILYGDEGMEYKSKSNKLNNKINHKILKKKEEIRENSLTTNITNKNNLYIEPFKSKGQHHLKEHFKKIVKNLTDDEKQQEKALTALNGIYYNGLSEITHDDLTLQERQYAILNEASMMYSHGSTQEEVNDYLKNNNVNDYKIDFANSSNDAIVAINKKTNKVTLAFRGSSLTSRAKNDWLSNGEILRNPNLNTEAHQRVDDFYNSINELYEIEHITGYSRGGHFAEYLSNKYDEPLTAFNAFISPSNIKNSKEGKSIRTHISTSEDVVSPLRNILALNRRNINIKTIHPTTENSKLTDLVAGHNNNNFTNIEALPRERGRRIILTENIVNKGKKLGELDMVEKGKIILENGGSFTDFLRRVTPNDIIEESSLIDGSKKIKYSPRIKGGGIETKIWNELGGEINRLENLRLSQNPNTEEVIFETSRLERLDHSNAPQHIRRKNINHLETELQETITNLNETQTGKDNISSRRNYGLTPKNIGSLISAPLFGQSVSNYGGKEAGDFTTGFVAGSGGFKGRLGSGGAMLVTGKIADAVTTNIEDETTKNIVNSAVAMGGIPLVEGAVTAGGAVLGVVEAPVLATVLASSAVLTGVGAGLGYAFPILQPAIDPVIKPIQEGINFAVDNTIGRFLNKSEE